MSFKLFRRGSARCIGLLSAFVTILLCLYYISIGQPNQAHSTDANALGLAMSVNRAHESSLNSFNVDAGKTAVNKLQPQQQSQHQQQQQQLAQQQKHYPSTQQHENLDSTADAETVRNVHWGDKCYVLLQSKTNITASEEHSRFDFQVCNHGLPLY